MAALSLTPIGLASYGDVHLRFSDGMCEPRASLLSENSFDFVGRHPVDPEQLPPGHRATWQDRARLGLVVAERRLRGVRSADAFPEILIALGTTRHNDRFMEVHIYGDWTIEAVESAKIRSSALTDDYKRMQASKLGDLLHDRGIPWEIVA